MKDPSGLTYSQIARRLGIKPNKIAMLKCRQKYKFDYILSLHPNFEEGYRRYEQKREETMASLQELYYELESRRELSAFSRYLAEVGIYGSPQAWNTSSRYNYFRLDFGNTQHAALMRRIKVLAAYEDFKEVL